MKRTETNPMIVGATHGVSALSTNNGRLSTPDEVRRTREKGAAQRSGHGKWDAGSGSAIGRGVTTAGGRVAQRHTRHQRGRSERLCSCRAACGLLSALRVPKHALRLPPRLHTPRKTPLTQWFDRSRQPAGMQSSDHFCHLLTAPGRLRPLAHGDPLVLSSCGRARDPWGAVRASPAWKRKREAR